MKRLHKVLIAGAGLALLVTCMPDRLTEEEVDQKIAEAGCGGGNGSADDNEVCDDGNKKACDACEECGARRVLSVEGELDYLIVQTAGVEKLQTTPDDSFTVSMWIKPKENLVAYTFSTILIRGKEQSQRLLMFGVMGAPGSNALVPACVLNGKDTPAKDGDSVVAYDSLLKADQWHHIICAYNGETRVLSVAADLGQLKEAAAAVPDGATGPLFADGSFVAFGHMSFGPGTGKAKPFKGLIDEVRWSNTYPAKTPEFERRYDDDEAGTAFLFHLDGPAAGASYQVKSADGTLTAATPVITHTLSFANDTCYDTDGWTLLCEFAEDEPEWCKDVQQ